MQTTLTRLRNLLENATYGLSALKTSLTSVLTILQSTTYGPEVLKKVLAGSFRTKMGVYPTLAAGVTITGAVGAWTAGAWTEVVPVSTLTSGKFTIFEVVIESLTGVHQLELGYGLAGSEISLGSVRLLTFGRCQFHCPVVASGSRIVARTATSAESSQSIVIALHYKYSDE